MLHGEQSCFTCCLVSSRVLVRCPRLGNIISACVGAAVVLIDSADGQCKIQTKSDQFYIHCFSNLRTLFVDSGQYSTGQHEAQIPNMVGFQSSRLVYSVTKLPQFLFVTGDN